MKTLKGKVALVTGATKGLGKGIAIELAKNGAEVIINYHSSGSLPLANEIVEHIQNEGGRAFAIQADVSNEISVNKMFDTIESHYKRLDILINNAGTSQAKDIFDITTEDWHRIIETNLTSGYYCSKRAMVLMKKNKFGRIIFISSMVAHQGALFGHVHYAATKSGQLGMVKTLARTGASLGITVNAVAPGIIDTELLHQTHGDEGVAALSKTVPLGLGTVEDVGYAVVFLSGEESGYITGITLDVNGGMYMH